MINNNPEQRACFLLQTLEATSSRYDAGVKKKIQFRSLQGFVLVTVTLLPPIVTCGHKRISNLDPFKNDFCGGVVVLCPPPSLQHLDSGLRNKLEALCLVSRVDLWQSFWRLAVF